MGTIPAFLDGRAALGLLRRSLPRGSGRLVPCRTGPELEGILRSRLVDVVVLGPAAAHRNLAAVRAAFPTIPVVIYGVVRAEDAEPLLRWDEAGVSLVLVEGVDDAVAGDLLLRHAASRRRTASLAELPRLLRLTERLQLRAWDRLASGPGRPPRTGALARALGVSREHLSRQFGAGGAPTLKGVSDLLAVGASLELLANPGHSTATVARLMGFATSSHLGAVIRRVTGLCLPEARGLGSRDVVRRFLRNRHSSAT
ncbi:MAG TPA: AraC family transcriptional regulator [Gemmatimonadales bacterium]|nr:AraC family transcriptional regulator [Gemmatimonadales bacterium]